MGYAERPRDAHTHRAHQHCQYCGVQPRQSARIVSGSVDNTLKVWDVQSVQEMHTLTTEHTGWVASVAFNADGRRIVNGSVDRTVKVWNTTRGQETLPRYDEQGKR